MGPTARRSRASRPALRVGSPAIATEWLREEIGKNHLACLFNRNGVIVYTPREGEEGYIPLTSDGGSDGPAQIRPANAVFITALVQCTYSPYREHTREEQVGSDESATTKTTRVRASVLFPKTPAQYLVEVPHLLPNLRLLRGVVHVPIVRSDGSILYEAGYDRATRLLHLPEPGLVVPAVSANPSRTEIADAVGLLSRMVAEFSFVSDGHRANYFGLLVTPILRELVPPPYKLGSFTAPQPGSGKSLLAGVMRAVHGGVFRSEVPTDEAELGKQISAILDTTTAPVCQFDNVTGVLRSATLAGLLTSGIWESRRLGTQTQISCPNDRLWVITGNNICISGDLARRTVSVTIDPGVPNPHLRTNFAIRNLEGWAREHRGQLLAALLTLVSAWVAAGRSAGDPRGSDSFASWIEAIDGILNVAGIAGSFDSPETTSRILGSDDDEWAEFLDAAYRLQLKNSWKGWTTKELLAHADTSLTGTPQEPSGPFDALGTQPPATTLADALPTELAEKVARSSAPPATAIGKSLGRWLANRDGRWAGGLTARCDRDPAGGVRKDRTGATVWHIEAAKDRRS
jgi:hypothetical protein